MSRVATSIVAVGAVALALIAAPAAVASNSKSTPTPLVTGVAQQENTSGYSVEGGEQNTISPFTNQCGTGNGVGVARTAWYSIQGTGGTATVTTAGFDTALFAYAASPAGVVVACNDDYGGGLSSSITFPTTAGTTYAIQAGTSCTELGPPKCTDNPAGGALTIKSEAVLNHDLDGDGVTGSQFAGADCNDNDVRVHPGAYDVPGDGVDQDCDGHDAALPRPSAIKVPVAITSHVHKRYALVAKLAARRPRRQYGDRVVHQQEARLQVHLQEDQREGHQDDPVRQALRQGADQGQAQEGRDDRGARDQPGTHRELHALHLPQGQGADAGDAVPAAGRHEAAEGLLVSQMSWRGVR